RPPLYPGLVATIYFVAGDHNYTAVRLVQSLLGVLTAAIVFLLGRRMYDERTGLAAAAICACYPSLIAATGLVLTETLFALLLCMSCLLAQRYFERGNVWWLAGFAAVLACGALTRSVLWLFPP